MGIAVGMRVRSAVRLDDRVRRGTGALAMRQYVPLPQQLGQQQRQRQQPPDKGLATPWVAHRVAHRLIHRVTA